MFEDRTFQNILRECFEHAPEGIDLRQGSIFFDAVSAACFKIAEYYADLRHVFDLVFVETAVGTYLDLKGGEFGVFRRSATFAKYAFNWSGSGTPEVGERFFTDGMYFVLRFSDEHGFYLESEVSGIVSNNILSGTPAIPVRNLRLGSASFGEIIEPGANIEDDETYRARVRERIAGPAENGNRAHYRLWSESVDGVGRAKIYPLFAGPNTVKGIIIGVDGLPAVQSVLDRVQEHIDPMTLGRTVEFEGRTIPVGDGLGDGVANIGAHFAAVAPSGFDININFAAEVRQGFSVDTLKETFSSIMIDFLKNLALSSQENTITTIRISAISNMLYRTEGLVDYADLQVNGGTANIAINSTEVAVLGEVIIREIVR